MSRFVIRSLTKIGQNPPPNGKDINKHNRIRTRSRKEGTNPCKGEAKPPPKVSPPDHPPPFFRHAMQRFTKGSGWVEPRNRARTRKGTSRAYESKAKTLLMSFPIENPQGSGRELTDRKQILKSWGAHQTISVKKDRTLNSTRRRDPFHAKPPPPQCCPKGQG